MTNYTYIYMIICVPFIWMRKNERPSGFIEHTTLDIKSHDKYLLSLEIQGQVDCGDFYREKDAIKMMFKNHGEEHYKIMGKHFFRSHRHKATYIPVRVTMEV